MSTAVDPVKLRDLLGEKFDLADLQDLCFEMAVEYDDLPGDTLRAKSRELVKYCAKRDTLDVLLVHARRLRPAVDWAAETRADSAPAATPDAPPAAGPLPELRAFKALLDESWALFLSHNEQRGRLFRMITANHHADLPPFAGYDDLFYKMYDALTPEERELFAIVRGNTKRGMHRMNGRLLAWVEAHPIAALLPARTAAVAELEAQLLALRIHLEEWFAKYEETFLPDERRTLVYLGDEKRHGRQWPKALEPALSAVIAELEAGP